MRTLALVLVLLSGCAGPAVIGPTATAQPTPRSTATESPRPTPVATASAPPASPPPSTPESVTVTFRITLTGPVPADAAFGVQDGVVGLEQHAVYLCVYYGGTAPSCASGGSYEDVLSVPPGTRPSYSFWRELDVNGTHEDLKAGQVTVGLTGEVVSVTYDFPKK